MNGARLGTAPARPGILLAGAAPPPDPPDPWPPPGLTVDEKLDLILNYLGPPRYDILPGSWNLTGLVMALAGFGEA